MPSSVMKVILAATGVIALSATLSAQALPIPTTELDFFQPGTQPNELNFDIIAGNACTLCHAGFDPITAPYDRWQTSIMAQATRDPLFWACLAIAEQDVTDIGHHCLRCHTPSGWLAGRADPTDGSALTGINDFDGVTCHFCHRTLDPDVIPGAPAEDQGIVDNLVAIPGANVHSGQYVVDPDDNRRGPFELLPGFSFHEWRESPYHHKAKLCGTCHDVSNPVFVKVGDDYVPSNLNQAHPTHDPYDQFPIERTFSEWKMSDFAQAPVDMGGLFGGNDPLVSTCQDCHMPKVEGYACSFTSASVFRTNIPQHDFNGSHTWVLDAIMNLDNTLELYDTPAYMPPLQVEAAKARNISMLQRASEMDLEFSAGQLKVTVTNNTGHKLPSGYPEGRRIWINVRFEDDLGNLILEHGQYDFGTAILTTGDTKVYEVKLGLDSTMAALTGLPPGESFHFALNNTYIKDNRIPPRGFTNANFEIIQAAPVAYSYADGQYWDDSFYPQPVGSSKAIVKLYYQTASKEYIEFLLNENTTNDRGQILYDQWLALDKGPPVLMKEAEINFPILVPSFIRSDCNDDGNLDIADVIFSLDNLFAGGNSPACDDACDVNDDGGIDIGDPIYQLSVLFSGGALPPAPYPACGADPTTDTLGCGAGSACP